MRLVDEFRTAITKGGTAVAELEIRSNPAFFLKMLHDERRARLRAEERANVTEAAAAGQEPPHDVTTVGELLGFAGGAFGRDNYGPNECVAVLTIDGEPGAVFRTAPREYTAVLVGEELRNAVAADLADTDGMLRR
ncbi:hypothetical protein [Curtobacterium sp. MCSS17_016]|uniref:hypothetical protein n=1 Tax=Curtobacterium sp. MCSS17_016 TaxID=2175644 RepID=UPI000DA914BF|nr:hypothetical protein [Curtobacterium sp. MCSS17_016]WIE81370.1 hypothetical protein DEJ19_019235 [Curtobacterium sp. MCSS17_016]